jgi:hypothetical protein
MEVAIVAKSQIAQSLHKVQTSAGLTEVAIVAKSQAAQGLLKV